MRIIHQMKQKHRKKSAIFTAIFSGLVAGCATMPQPENVPGSYYAPSQISDRNKQSEQLSRLTQCHNAPRPTQLLGKTQTEPFYFAKGEQTLSSGDTILMTVAGDPDGLSGNHIIAANGTVRISGLAPLLLAGISIEKAQNQIREALITHGLIRSLPNNVSIHLVELGSADISVAGAVFQPGVNRVGERDAETRTINLARAASGDRNNSRTLTRAIQSSGGVRPDADVSSIYLIRQNKWAKINLSGAFDGTPAPTIPLTAGDQIIIPSRSCFQSALVRPSAITPPGIRVFMSNLSRPAGNNASAAIGREATSIPYGSRLSHAATSANCVGGSAMNARRKVVLMSRNPINGKSIVVSRSIEALVRHAQRNDFDPYVMPGDALACYDSGAMNFRDVLSLIGETVSPYLLLRNVN